MPPPLPPPVNAVCAPAVLRNAACRVDLLPRRRAGRRLGSTSAIPTTTVVKATASPYAAPYSSPGSTFRAGRLSPQPRQQQQRTISGLFSTGQRTQASRSSLTSFTTTIVRTTETRRTMATANSQQPPRRYEAVVVGAGPAGVTCVGNLLERKVAPILWIDDGFDGGRVNRRYREVPSNTKVKLFIDFATACTPFRKIVAGTPSRSRWEETSDSDTDAKEDKLQPLRSLDQEKGCRLSYAADMILMLTKGLERTAGVHARAGRMTEGVLDPSTNEWTIRMSSAADGDGDHSLDLPATAVSPRLVLCTGASPKSAPLPSVSAATQQKPQPLNLDLDTVLSPTSLHQLLSPLGPPLGPITVAVIGASHSAVLALMNLTRLARDTKPDLRIKWFTRHPLRYAEYMDGWILRDNTGLKGDAAAWAKANLEPDKLPHSPVRDFLQPINYAAGDEHAVLARHLPGCRYVVHAIGYLPDPLPALKLPDGSDIRPRFVHETGAFVYPDGGAEKKLPGLYGAGIAFPERVTDPHGNVEYAVGFFKFMKFVKRVSPEWN